MYGNGTMGMFALLKSPYLSKVHTEIFPHETVLGLPHNNPRGWGWGVGRSRHVISLAGPELKIVNGWWVHTFSTFFQT